MNSNHDHNNCHPHSLSDLPKNIISEILAKLPIKTAVCTSLVSAAWRWRWRWIPELRLHNLSESIISRILLLHNGPICKFQLVLPLPPPSTDSWLIFLSDDHRNSIRTLVLYFTEQTITLYRLNSSAFSFCYLNTLCLGKCEVALPKDQVLGFEHLSTLKFYGVRIDGSDLSRLIETSLKLKVVYLVDVNGEGCLRICGQNIHTIYNNTAFDDFVLGNCPVLKNAAINVKNNIGGHQLGRHDSTHWLPLGRPELQNLSAFMNPESVPFTFAYLSAMVMHVDFADIRSVVSTICLLRSCPNMKSLCFSGANQNEYETGSRDIFIAIQDFDIFTKLRTAEFINFMSKEFEDEVLRLILEKAVLLNKVVITFHKTMVIDKVATLKKLLQFRRASKEAKIICTG